jgi:hypothetical protein
MAYVIDDRTGFKVKVEKTNTEWTGRVTVDPDFRHPQEFVRGRADNQSVPFRRPAETVEIPFLLNWGDQGDGLVLNWGDQGIGPILNWGDQD